MTDLVSVQPVLRLVSCCATRAQHVEAINHDGVDGVDVADGAVGVGFASVPDLGSVFFLSIHHPDGETMMAALHVDDAVDVVRLLTGQINAHETPDPSSKLPN